MMGLIKTFAIVGIASLAFPILANRFLGLALPTDTSALIKFVVLGISSYGGFIFSRFGYRILKKGMKLLPSRPVKTKKEIQYIEKVRYVQQEPQMYAQPAYSEKQAPVYAPRQAARFSIPKQVQLGPIGKKNDTDLFKNYVKIGGKEPDLKDGKEGKQ